MRYALLLFFAAPLFAQDAIQVPWKQVCQAAGDRPLVLTTNDGRTVEGRCMSVTVDEIAIRQETRTVRITRSTLSRIRVHRTAQGRQLLALHRAMHRNLRSGLAALFSPMAPAGLVYVPVTLAWGAVAAPFCILSDIGDGIAGLRDIHVM